MRHLSPASFAISIALCFPASAQASQNNHSKVPRNTENMTEPGAMSQKATNGQFSMNSQDAAFLGQAAMFNAPEIHAALVAEDQADSPDVKAYARLSLSDHNDMANDLSALAGRYGDNLPNPCAQGGAGDEAINQLKSEHGESFDRAYMTAQVKSLWVVGVALDREGTDQSMMMLAS